MPFFLKPTFTKLNVVLGRVFGLNLFFAAPATPFMLQMPEYPSPEQLLAPHHTHLVKAAPQTHLLEE